MKERKLNHKTFPFRRDYWIFIVWFVLLADQLTKFIIRSNIEYGERVPVFLFTSLTYHINQGAGFGIMQGWKYVLIGIGVIIMFIVTWQAPELDTRSSFLSAVLVGGIAGNLIDRIVFDGVTDFISVMFYFKNTVFVWPTFNIADIAITLSIIMMCIIMLKEEVKKN